MRSTRRFLARLRRAMVEEFSAEIVRQQRAGKMPLALERREAARAIGISPEHLRRWISAGLVLTTESGKVPMSEVNRCSAVYFRRGRKGV